MPARTPAATVNRLNQDILRVINQSDMKEKLLNAGVETIGNSPQLFAAKIESEMAKLGKIIKEAGIRVD